jgi:RND family efflux transporter MFP subunit
MNGNDTIRNYYNIEDKNQANNGSLKESKDKKKSILGKILNILFIIGLIVGGYFAYQYLLKNPIYDEGENNKKIITENNNENENTSNGNVKNVQIIEINENLLKRINFKKTGTVAPYKKALLVAESSGIIKNFSKTEGDKIKKDEKIAEISDSASSKIAKINYQNALKNLELAKEALEKTKNSISNDEYNALLAIQTAELNYLNAIKTYNNLAENLEEQIRSAKIGVQSAEIAVQNAQEAYYNSLATANKTSDDILAQSLDGIMSSFSLIETSISTLNEILNLDNETNNLKDDINYIEDYYDDLFDEYEKLYQSTENKEGIIQLIENLIDLTEETEFTLHNANELLKELSNNGNIDQEIVTNLEVNISTLIPSLDQSKLNLNQSKDAVTNSVINKQIQPENAFNALEAAESQLVAARQNVKQLESTKKSQLDAAQNNINLAEKQLESAKAKLQNIKIKGSLQEINAETQVTQLESQVDITKANLESIKIYSPLNGILLEKYIENGNYINPSQKIALIGDMSKVKITVSVTSEELTYIKLGQKVEIKGPGDINQDARITKIFPTFDPISKKIKIEIIAENNKSKFKSGMFIDVIFKEAKKQVPAIYIPFKSIIFERENAYIFTVENNKAVKKEVKLGEILNNEIEIINGVRYGDKVITDGAKNLKDGEKVKIIKK